MEHANAVKIFGVGGAGVNVLEQMARAPLPNATMIAVSIGGASSNPAPSDGGDRAVIEKMVLEPKQLRGLGAGGDPERGRALAEENVANLKEACAGADVVFIIAGLGGGAGTGISPVLARAAKESGALALGFVVMPFDCEGSRRRQQARVGLEELKAVADGVICLPNQKILKLIDESTSAVDTFRQANELLAEGVGGVWHLMARKGLIELHFADLCAVLRDRHGESLFATAEASGATRSQAVVEKLLAHPMLDGGTILGDSDAVLVSLTGGADLTMAEIGRVMEHIGEKCGRAEVLLGAAVDEKFQDRLAVTLIASRSGEPLIAKAGLDEAARAAGRPAEELDTQLLSRAATARPQSRFVPPAPALPPEKMEQLAARQSGGRGRRNSSKMRQGQLPLEIISKGRFDKSEPTIHRGEDLDVPTYIRRGVPLN